MASLQALSALLPSAVVLVAVLVLRVGGLVAALLAAIAAIVVWLAGWHAAPLPRHVLQALADTGVLTALVAAMVVPGIVFVEAARARRSAEAIAGLVGAVRLPPAQTAILIATGIGILVESLTGMGVSLLVTVPLLVALQPRRAAIGLALVGMSLMPWGALAISAHVGARVAGLPVDALQHWVFLVSGPVAFFLPLLCLLFVSAGWRDVGVALVAGVVLVAGIGLASHAIGIEVAGVAGGLGVVVLMMVLGGRRREVWHAMMQPGLVPYAVLLAAVVVQKFAVAPLAAAGIAPVLATDRVSFAVLTSPGVALLAATLLAAPGTLRPPLFAAVARRAWRPVLAIAVFMLSARLLVEAGAIAALAQSIGGLGQSWAVVVVGLLGAVGGFVTGSGVTGNVLFMASAAAAGESFGALPVFAALQNGASGHFGMASLPVTAIVLAALGRREAGDDAIVMRLGLALAAWHLGVAILAALILLEVT